MLKLKQKEPQVKASLVHSKKSTHGVDNITILNTYTIFVFLELKNNNDQVHMINRQLSFIFIKVKQCTFIHNWFYCLNS